MLLIVPLCPTPGQPVAPSRGMGESLASMLARITRPVMLPLQSTPILYRNDMRRIAGGRRIAIWLWICRGWRLRICRLRICRQECWRRLRGIRWRRLSVCWQRGICWRWGIRWRRGVSRRGIVLRGWGVSRRGIVRRGRPCRRGVVQRGLLLLPDVGRREVLQPGHVGFAQGLRRARGAAREVDVHTDPLAGAVRHRQRRFRPCFGLNRLRNVPGSSPSI